jgi:hypothetical protein
VGAFPESGCVPFGGFLFVSGGLEFGLLALFFELGPLVFTLPGGE